MNKKISWPKPPIPSIKTPPKVPDQFEIFGLSFTINNDMPFLKRKETEAPLSTDNLTLTLRKALKSSLDIFYDAINNLSQRKDATAAVMSLKNLHISINSTLSKCRRKEAIDNLHKLKRERIEAIKKSTEKLEEKMRSNFMPDTKPKMNSLQKFF